MSSYARTDNDGEIVQMRQEAYVGGTHIFPNTIPLETWIRLMYSSNDGEKVAGNPRQLNIGAMTDRRAIYPGDLSGWRLQILNAGYFQYCRVAESDGGILTLEEDIRGWGGLPDSGIEWIIYPKLVNNLAVTFIATSWSEEMRIGVMTEEQYTVEADKVREVTRLSKPNDNNAKTLIFENIQVDKLCVWFDRKGNNQGVNRVSWGEYDIHLG